MVFKLVSKQVSCFLHVGKLKAEDRASTEYHTVSIRFQEVQRYFSKQGCKRDDPKAISLYHLNYNKMNEFDEESNSRPDIIPKKCTVRRYTNLKQKIEVLNYIQNNLGVSYAKVSKHFTIQLRRSLTRQSVHHFSFILF